MTDIKHNHIRRFTTLANKLNDLMIEVRKYSPEANLYAEDSYNLHLMSGESHGERFEPMTENIVASVDVTGLSGGGW